MRCTYCGAQAHTAATCPHSAKGQAGRRSMRCTYCGSSTHNYNGCPKIHPAHTIKDDDHYED